MKLLLEQWNKFLNETRPSDFIRIAAADRGEDMTVSGVRDEERQLFLDLQDKLETAAQRKDITGGRAAELAQQLMDELDKLSGV